MSEVHLRRASGGDVAAIVALLADDDLGAARETPEDLAPYRRAFAAIEADLSELLVVAERGGQVVGTVQVSFLPGLSRAGALRAQLEGVRVARTARGAGVGQAMISWAVEVARTRGCSLVQLSSDASRAKAHRFYEDLGFTASHRGYKLALDQPESPQGAAGGGLRTGSMRVVTTYDEEVDAGYLYLGPRGGAGSVARTIEATEGQGVDFMVNLDLSHHGHLVGIEVVGVRDALGEQAFAAFTRQQH